MGSWFSRSGYSESPQRLDKQIYIKTTSGKLISLNVRGENLIYNVKEKIQDIEGISPDRQILQYGKEVLDQSSQLLSYNIHGECVLKLTEWVIDIANTANGKVIRFEVEPSMMIWDIKQIIEDKKGIPSEYQLLFKPGRDVDTELLECEFIGQCIAAGSTVYLRVRQILVQVHTGERFTVPVSADDTIQNVKEKIQEEKGFPCDEQHIFWDGRKLENDEPIDKRKENCPDGYLYRTRWYKSKLTKCELLYYLVHKRSFEDMYIITVNEPCKKTIAVEVKSCDSIDNVKEKIQDIEKIPLGQQQLYFTDAQIPVPMLEFIQAAGYRVRNYTPATPLEDDRTLVDYNIKEGTVLKLHVGGYKRLIIVNTIFGEEMMLEVPPSCKVEKVLEMAHDMLGETLSQRFLFLYNGEQLQNGNPLSDYEIPEKRMFLLHPNPHGILLIVKILITYNIVLDPKTRVVLLEVEATDSVEILKIKIQNKVGYLPDKLLFNGCVLENGQTLSDHNIHNWAVICMLKHVKLVYQSGIFGNYQVYVKIPTGNTETVQVKSSDTIKDVKEKIQERTGILIDRHELMFDGCQLEDQKTVRDYSIKPEMFLHLVPKSLGTDDAQIFILKSCGQTIELSFNPNVTISDIKAEIQSKERIQIEKYMVVYEGKVVEEDKTLSYHDIKSCSLLHLLESRCSMQITVKTDDGETASIPVNPNDTVLSLKVRIWVEIEGMCAPCKQRLIYNDECLHDSRFLSFYSIDPDSTIKVNTSDPINLIIKCPSGTLKNVHVYLDETVVILKSRLQHKFQTDSRRLQLYCNSEILANRLTLLSYGIKAQDLVLLCKSEFTSELSSEVGPGGRQITWSEEGLKVNVPAGVVPDGQEITMVIRKYNATHASFIFPAHTEPVSPVYEMYWSHDVNQGMVQVSITHTSPITHQGCFVQASRAPSKLKTNLMPEFHFAQIPGGGFDKQSLRGSIFLQHFNCYVAVANHKPPSSWIWGLFSWIGLSESNIDTVATQQHSAPTSIQGSSRKREQTEGHDGEDLPTVQAKRVRQDSITEETEPQEEKDTQLLLEQISQSTSQSYTAPAHKAPNTPELKDLVIVLKAVEWHSLGIQLGIEKHVLDRIDDQYPQKLIDRKCSEMLGHWLDNESNPTWEKIVTALERLGGYSAVVRTIHSKTITH